MTASSICGILQQTALPNDKRVRYPTTDQEDGICRDYVWGICSKGPHCKFRHELKLESMKNILRFCHDFQNRSGCNRPACTYLHTTNEEEQLFLRTGQIPRVLSERYAAMAARTQANMYLNFSTQPPLPSSQPPPRPPPPPSTPPSAAEPTAGVQPTPLPTQPPTILAPQPPPPPSTVLSAGVQPPTLRAQQQTLLAPPASLSASTALAAGVQPPLLRVQLPVSRAAPPSRTAACASVQPSTLRAHLPTLLVPPPPPASSTATSVGDQPPTLRAQLPTLRAPPPPSSSTVTSAGVRPQTVPAPLPTLLAPPPPPPPPPLAPTVSTTHVHMRVSLFAAPATANTSVIYPTNQPMIDIPLFDASKPPPPLPINSRAPKNGAPKRPADTVAEAGPSKARKHEGSQINNNLCERCVQREMRVEVFRKEALKLERKKEYQSQLYEQKLQAYENGKLLLKSTVSEDMYQILENYIEIKKLFLI